MLANILEPLLSCYHQVTGHLLRPLPGDGQNQIPHFQMEGAYYSLWRRRRQSIQFIAQRDIVLLRYITKVNIKMKEISTTSTPNLFQGKIVGLANVVPPNSVSNIGLA